MRRWTLTTLCLATVCSLPAMAAVKTTQTVVFHGYGPNNAGKSRSTMSTLIQGAKSRTETTMEFEGKVMKRLTGKQIDISITDAEAKVMRTLNPKRETYTEMTFEEFLTQRDEMAKQLAELRGQSPERPEQSTSSRPQMEFEPPKVTVTEAGRDTIAGYDARLLDVLIQMVGKYPESTEICEINVDAKLGFAETPGFDEVRGFHEKLAAELGFSKAQMLGAGQSVLSAMGKYAEGFEKLYDEIKKQKGSLVRQNLRVKVKGSCGGPPGGRDSDRGSAGASGPDGDDAEPVAPKARMKKMFGKLKLGRKKSAEKEVEPDAAKEPPAADDAFIVMLRIDLETESCEKVADVGSGPFDAPANWKKVEHEPSGLANVGR